MSDKEAEAVYDLAALAQTYLQRAEAAEALLAQRTARSEGEVRGYVVLTDRHGPADSPRYSLAHYAGLFEDADDARAEVARHYHDGHVGVVTALPARPADVEAFRVAFWSDAERAAAERARMAEVEGGAPVEVDDPAEIQRRLDALAALPAEPPEGSTTP